MPTPRTPAANEMPANRAEAILVAAEALFAQHGFEGVSMSAVAQLAGVSKANVFHHFGSKDDLYYAVLRRARRQLTHNVLSVGEKARSDIAAGLRQVASAYLDNILQQQHLARVLLREALERPPGRAKDLAEKVFGENFNHLVQFLREAQERNTARKDVDPAAAVVLLVAACVFFFQSSDVLRHLPAVDFADDPQSYVDRFVDILLHGIQQND